MLCNNVVEIILSYCSLSEHLILAYDGQYVDHINQCFFRRVKAELSDLLLAAMVKDDALSFGSGPLSFIDPSIPRGDVDIFMRYVENKESAVENYLKSIQVPNTEEKPSSHYDQGDKVWNTNIHSVTNYFCYNKDGICKFQVIKTINVSPLGLMQLTDFSCCKNYFTGSKFFLHRKSIYAILNKTLDIRIPDYMFSYQGREDQYRVVLFYSRWAKYIGKGFKTRIIQREISNIESQLPRYFNHPSRLIDGLMDTDFRCFNHYEDICGNEYVQLEIYVNRLLK